MESELKVNTFEDRRDLVSILASNGCTVRIDIRHGRFSHSPKNYIVVFTLPEIEIED